MEYFDGAGVKWAGGFDWRWNQRPKYLDGAVCPILGMKLESNWLDCLEWTGAKGLDYLVEAGVKWAGQIG
jgi:hypothetical protein